MSITQTSVPIEIRINCPMCRTLHVDEGVWATKPHHTHACQACGHVWRPAVVHTVGVRFLPGFKNEVEDKPAEDGVIYKVGSTRGISGPIQCGACMALNMRRALDRFGMALPILKCGTCGALERA